MPCVTCFLLFVKQKNTGVKDLELECQAQAQHWCFISVFPGIWEAKMRRIAVPGQPREKKFARTHFNRKQTGYAPVIPVIA
jgi:hypothetical protein